MKYTKEDRDKLGPILKNLLQRLSFNEKQRLWRLEGPITMEEYKLLTDAIYEFHLGPEGE